MAEVQLFSTVVLVSVDLLLLLVLLLLFLLTWQLCAITATEVGAVVHRHVYQHTDSFDGFIACDSGAVAAVAGVPVVFVPAAVAAVAGVLLLLVFLLFLL